MYPYTAERLGMPRWTFFPLASIRPPDAGWHGGPLPLPAPGFRMSIDAVRAPRVRNPPRGVRFGRSPDGDGTLLFDIRGYSPSKVRIVGRLTNVVPSS